MASWHRGFGFLASTLLLILGIPGIASSQQMFTTQQCIPSTHLLCDIEGPSGITPIQHCWNTAGTTSCGATASLVSFPAPDPTWIVDAIDVSVTTFSGYPNFRVTIQPANVPVPSDNPSVYLGTAAKLNGTAGGQIFDFDEGNNSFYVHTLPFAGDGPGLGGCINDQCRQNVSNVERLITYRLDTDIDGIADASDNCSAIPNGPSEASNQLDEDEDGYGTACDADYNQDLLTTTSDFTTFVDCFTGATSIWDCAIVNHNGDVVAATGAPIISTADFTTFQAFYTNPTTTAPGPSGLSCAGSSPCP